MAYGKKAAATAGFLLLFGAIISAQMGRPMVPSAVPHTVTSGVVSTGARNGQGMLHGTAVDRDSSPLPNAMVRLRNLSSGEIEKVLTADQAGEFTFIVTPEIPYVVEIADQAGKVLAIGNVVTAQAGEVAGSIVSVPVRLPAAMAGLMGDTASSVVSAASGAGITALKSAEFEPPPASPDN
jgi:hypothetical protein